MPHLLRFPVFLLLVAPACDDRGDPSGSSAEMVARLDKIDERLGAIEGSLDGTTTKLESVSAWVDKQVVEQQRLAKEKEARRVDREAARAERAAQRKARREAAGLGGFSGSFDVDDEDPAPPTGREIEGAADSVRCEAVSEDASKCTVERAFLDKLIGNPALLAKQARVVPSQKDGTTNGFKLYGIRRGSLPKLLTFKNGDTVTAINDDELRSIDEAMAVYTKLRRAKHFDIEILRKGRIHDLAIDIVE